MRATLHVALVAAACFALRCHAESGDTSAPAGPSGPASCSDAGPSCPQGTTCTAGVCLDAARAARTAVVRASAVAPVYGGEVVLGYDPSAVAFADPVGAGTDGGLVAARASGGELRLAFASAQPFEDGAPLLSVTFYALRDGVGARDLVIRSARIVGADGRAATAAARVE